MGYPSLRVPLSRQIVFTCDSYRNFVCLSVTPRHRLKSRSDSDSGSLPYDSVETLVSNEGIKEIVILPLLTRLTWERLQIDADLLLIITSTEYRGYQHRWPWTTVKSKIGGFSEFFAISSCDAHLKSEFSPKLLEIDQDNLRMKLNWRCRASHKH